MSKVPISLILYFIIFLSSLGIHCQKFFNKLVKKLEINEKEAITYNCFSSLLNYTVLI